ncbi:MAG: hypothetical protein Q9M36_09495 [Sulfurovum sp.]|nr:hypothetical protein [Sulfurovum sp.]
MAATRDDAKKVAILADVKTCFTNVIAEYTATGVENTSAAGCTNPALTVAIIANGINANKVQVSYVIPGEGTTTLNKDFKGTQVSF